MRIYASCLLAQWRGVVKENFCEESVRRQIGKVAGVFETCYLLWSCLKRGCALPSIHAWRISFLLNPDQKADCLAWFYRIFNAAVATQRLSGMILQDLWCSGGNPETVKWRCKTAEKNVLCTNISPSLLKHLLFSWHQALRGRVFSPELTAKCAVNFASGSFTVLNHSTHAHASSCCVGEGTAVYFSVC